MAKVVVVGGAGYVGCHTACAFSNAGHDVVVIDNLSSGRAENVKWGSLTRADLNDMSVVRSALSAIQPDLVVHCAGAPSLSAGEDYAQLHRAHIGATLSLMEAMIGGNVRRIVLASSCEVYGAPVHLPIRETHTQAPRDPLAWSHYVSEKIVQDLSAANGARYAIVRSFNIVGMSPACGYGGSFPGLANPLPLMLGALGRGERAYDLYGIDHPTRDGTLERCLLHVSDVAEAHLLAGERLLANGESLVCNLGRGRGTTLNEMIVMLRRVSGGARLNINPLPRRFEDSPRLFAGGQLAAQELSWRPKIGVEAAIRSAYQARQSALS